MNFPCPKCNTPDKGVLLFNLVAPCDACSCIILPKKKDKFTIELQKDLPSLGIFVRAALACGEDKELIQRKLDSGYDFIWTLYEGYSTHRWFTEYQDNYCVVQWSE